MATTASGSGETVACPICAAGVTLGVDERCARCHVDATDPRFLQIIEADRQTWEYRAEYDALMARWREVTLQREGWANELLAGRQAGRPAGQKSAAAPSGFWNRERSLSRSAGGAGPSGEAIDPFRVSDGADGSGPTWSAPGSERARPVAASASAAPVAGQRVSGDASPARPSRRAPRRLSAPTLLGISGASMLITAAIVFIAVTWSTIFPLAQGLLVLATAAAIAWLAQWLTRQDLGVSGGAVGVVAMGFAGVAIIAFDRAETNIGEYSIPIALFVSAASGYALSRRNVRWVGPMAALSLFAAMGMLALTFAGEQGAGSPALSTVVGVACGAGVGFTVRWWVTLVEKWIIRVGSVAVMALSVVPAGLELAGDTSLDGVMLAAALVPVAALAVAGRWIPSISVGPAMLVATAVAAAAVVGPTDNGAPSVAAGAITASILLALVGFRPTSWRAPALIGAASVAVASLVLVGAELVGLGAWVVGFRVGDLPPEIDEWAAVSCLALAAGVAATRTWRDRPAWLGRLEVPGAVLATIGFAGLAFPITGILPEPHVWGLALVLEVGGVATAAVALAWRSTRARSVSGIGGVAVGTLGALNAVWPLVQRTLPIAVPLALGAAAIIALVVCGRRWPRACLGPAAFLLPVFAAATAADGDQWTRACAVGAAVAAGLLWTQGRLPASWRAPVVAGLSLPLAAAVGASFFWSVPELVRAVGEGAGSAGPLDPWAGLVAAFAGLALAAFARHPMPAAAETAVGVIGAAVTLAAGAVFGLAAAASIDGGLAITVAWTETIGALGAVAFALLWRTTVAKATSGYGAAILMAVSGLNGFVAFGYRDTPLAIGLVACLLPVVLLIVLGRWWPVVALAPAALLLTGTAASAAYRYQLGDEAMIACAIAMAAVLAWAVKPLPNRFRRPAAAGLVPAAALAALFSVYVIVRAWVIVPDPKEWLPFNLEVELWATVATAVAALGVAAFLKGWGWTKGTEVAAGLGALFTMATASSATVWAVLGLDASPAVSALIVTGTGVAAALTAFVWTTPNARRAVGLWGVGWATFGGLLPVWAIGSGHYPAWPGLGAVAVPVALMVVASRWWPRATLGSVTLLVSLGAMVAVASWTDSWHDVAVAAAVSVALTAWFARLVGRRRGDPALLGILPAAVVTGYGLVTGFALALARLISDNPSVSRPWVSASLAVVGVAGAAALLAWRPTTRGLGWSPTTTDLLSKGWPFLPFLLIVSGSLPYPWATVLAFAAAVLGTLAAPREDPPRWHVRTGATMTCLVLGVLWVAREHVGFPVAAAVAAGISAWLMTSSARPFRNSALLGTHVFAAVAAGFAFAAAEAPAPVAYGAAMLAAFGVSIWVRVRNLDPGLSDTLMIAGVATVIIPIFSVSQTASGVALLIAGVGWLGHAVLGSRNCRWISSVVLSIGAALVLAGADVGVIEAYTAVPAGTALGVGLWWLAEDTQVRTLRALGPGLALALVPSYIALALEPNGLARTLALTAAVLILAVVGVLTRWFAPILATAVTAVTVSLTQVAVGSDIVPRWVSFAIVGAILIAIAATYEKLQKLR